MAQLDVQPKKSLPWWLWLLLALIAIGLILLLSKGCNHTTGTTATTDTTITTNKTDTASTTQPTIAATKPDWNSVDFNAPQSSDSDITDKGISVRGNANYTIFTLGENILFATDKNTLQASADAKLKQISASLNKHYKGATVAVYGNTDSTGSADHNKMLGAERAMAVRNWLMINAGLDSNKVSVQSLGAAKPVASNATASGRMQNRNVEIVAFPDKSVHQ